MIRRRYRLWAALPPAERRAFIEGWLLLAMVGVGLRWLDLRRLERWLERFFPLRPVAEPLPAVAIAAVDRLLAAAASNHLYPARCLHRSLALAAMLRRRGVDAELKIGVRLEGETLAAHAWLESHGQPIDVTAPQRFRTLQPSGAKR